MNAMARTIAELVGHAGLADAITGPARDFGDVRVRGVELDSRKVTAGDLFLALPGRVADGREFIAEAVSRGAAAVCVEGVVRGADREQAGAVPLFALEQLSAWAGHLAAAYYDQPSRALSVLGVTGTNGKTSVTHHLAEVLQGLGERCGICGTLGNGFPPDLRPSGMTTPDAVDVQRTLAWLRDAGARWTAMEVSSHALDQQRVNGIDFCGALFTNLTRDHLDYHGSMEAYAESKRQLFLAPSLEVAALNRDDPFGQALAERIPAAVDVLDFSLHEPRASVHVVGRETLPDGGTRLQLRSPWGQGECVTHLLGDFALSNLVGALTLLAGLGVSWPRLLAAADVHAVPGRMQTFQRGDGGTIVVDYAHTPDALDRVLQVLRAHTRGRLWCVFGCGGERDPGKRALMGAVAGARADRIVLTDDNPRSEDGDRIIAEIRAGVPKDVAVQVERDRGRAIATAVAAAHPDDLVLVAGKGHETHQDGPCGRRSFSDIDSVRQLVAVTSSNNAAPPGRGAGQG